MNITTTCTDRKKMATGLAEHLGCDCEYLRTPTYAYRVGNLQVERDSSITGERADLEAAAGWLLENGYISEPLPTEEAPAEEHTAEETATGANSKATADPEITHTCVSLPLAEFTPPSLINLLRILYARQRLICEMTQSDRIAIVHEVMTTLQSPDLNNMEILERVLRESIDRGFVKGIEVADGRLGIDFPYDTEKPTRWKHYADLLMAIADKAKAATRVSATLIEPEENEMKYFCRGFLLQLGLGGAAHKELRSVLLNHLHGYAAFRTAEKMDAHKQKYAELRRQLREQDSEAHSEVNDHEKG
ncbi:MAG: hypothetical protein IJA83_05545 [Clostridia bacterium]|nr:hypothetical protein [Clostridia bacterium]